LEIYPNNGNNNNYVKLVLKNLDVENNDYMLVCIKSILFIKNINDITRHIGKKYFFFFFSHKNYFYIYIYIIIVVIIIVIIKLLK